MRFCMRARLWQSCTIVALLPLWVGCGKGGGIVSGEVTIDGKPVDSGSIVFIPEDGQGPSRGGKIADGKFLLQGGEPIPPGKKTVKITASMKTGKQVEASPPAPPGMMIDEAVLINAPPQEAVITDGQNEPLTFAITTTSAAK